MKSDDVEKNLDGGDTCSLTVHQHTILRHRKYFMTLKLARANVSAISATKNLIERSERVNLILSRGIITSVKEDLYSTKSKRNLLSFKDIHLNELHIIGGI